MSRSSSTIGFLVAVGDARPPDPRARAFAQQRLERRDEAAGAALPRGRAVGQPLHVDRQPVGHDDEVGVTGLGVGRASPELTYASCFAGPMPSIDRKTRHSSASVA